MAVLMKLRVKCGKFRSLNVRVVSKPKDHIGNVPFTMCTVIRSF